MRIKLYKGNVVIVGRKSAFSLYDDRIASFEDDQGAYDQKDAAGFIKLQVDMHAPMVVCTESITQALRLRTLATNRGGGNGAPGSKHQ